MPLPQELRVRVSRAQCLSVVMIMPGSRVFNVVTRDFHVRVGKRHRAGRARAAGPFRDC